MTLHRFQTLLREVNPKLRVRQKGHGDIGGLFVGHSGKGGYIARITKGELTLAGYRMAVVDPKNKMRLTDGQIQKRGRKTLIKLLKNYRWIKNHKQVSRLTWGLHG